MIRIAVVGTGMIAQQMLPVLDKLPEIQMDVICGTKGSADIVESTKEKYQIARAYTDYETMLKTEVPASKDHSTIDMIYLAVPNHLHYDMAKLALEYGYHVFVEKPFTLHYEQSKELVAFARKEKLMVLEAISNQYLPIYESLKEALPRIGDVKLVEANFSQYSSRFDRFLAGEYFRVFDPELGGGALYDLNVYNFHMVVGLFGMPDRVSYVKNQMRGVDTSGIATLIYPDFVCTCLAAKDSQGPNQFFIQGTKGYLRIGQTTNTLCADLEFYDVATKTTQVLYPADTAHHRMEYEFVEFARMIEQGDFEACESRQEESLQVSHVVSMCIE